MTLAKVIASIERLNVLPGDLRIGDFVQRAMPARALRVLQTPYLMGVSGTYRIVGVSSNLGHDVIYRATDRPLPVVRGVPFGSRIELVTAAQAARVERSRLDRSARSSARTPGGVA